jgi:hypothetical protein
MVGVNFRNAAFIVILLSGGARIAGAAEASCAVATKGDSPVAQACSRGGQAEAKKVMKQLVRAAKDKGGKFTCDGCHKDPDAGKFELKPTARDDFQHLLELAGAEGQMAPQKK